MLAEDARSSAGLYAKYMAKAVTKVRAGRSAACVYTHSLIAQDWLAVQHCRAARAQ